MQQEDKNIVESQKMKISTVYKFKSFNYPRTINIALFCLYLKLKILIQNFIEIDKFQSHAKEFLYNIILKKLIIKANQA